jgi:hypothetical protein
MINIASKLFLRHQKIRVGMDYPGTPSVPYLYRRGDECYTQCTSTCTLVSVLQLDALQAPY